MLACPRIRYNSSIRAQNMLYMCSHMRAGSILAYRQQDLTHGVQFAPLADAVMCSRETPSGSKQPACVSQGALCCAANLHTKCSTTVHLRTYVGSGAEHGQHEDWVTQQGPQIPHELPPNLQSQTFQPQGMPWDLSPCVSEPM